MKWQASSVIFLHRRNVRKFVKSFEEDPSKAVLPVILKKIPQHEAAATEGTVETVIKATVNVAGIVKAGRKSINVTAEDLSAGGNLELCFSSNLPLQSIDAIDQVNTLKAPKVENPNPRQVSSNDGNKDALKEIRDEIVNTIERISQEYLAVYPNATTDGSIVANKDERRLEFLTFLANSGIFHELKENLRPRVQSLLREKFGIRGRALGRSETMRSLDLTYSEPGSSQVVSEETIETALSELYVFLQKECSVILNSMFSETIIDRDVNDLTKSAYINDEELTKMQEFKRLKEQAADAAADLRFAAAETIHLERIQLTTHSVSLGSNLDNIHEAHADYGVFLLQQAAQIASIAAPKSLKGSAPVATLLTRARETLAVAYKAKKDSWRVSLLYACLLIEIEQADEAEAVIHDMISSQLSDKSRYNLTSLQEFDGYDSDNLNPIDPKCHCVLATFFSLQKQPIKARKAILMANR